MRFPTLLVTVFSLLAVTEISSAAVAVWKGTGRQTLTATDEARPVTIFFIVDLSTFVGRTVVAIPSLKQVYDEGQRSYGLNQADTAPKGTLLLTDAIAIDQTGPIEFNHQIAVARGKTSTQFVGPQNTVPFELPKTFNYLLTKAAAGIFVQVASLVEGQLLFQKSRTQSANAVSKTVLAVSQEIRGELISEKGFTEITAP